MSLLMAEVSFEKKFLKKFIFFDGMITVASNGSDQFIFGKSDRMQMKYGLYRGKIC